MPAKMTIQCRMFSKYWNVQMYMRHGKLSIERTNKHKLMMSQQFLTFNVLVWQIIFVCIRISIRFFESLYK